MNRRLIGGHVHDSRPTPEQLALRPAFWRRVASAANRVHWDCDTETFADETLAEYHDEGIEVEFISWHHYLC